MQGMSGAVVYNNGTDYVVKHSINMEISARLRHQAHFMRGHITVFPRIVNIFDYGYVMEALKPIPTTMKRSVLLREIRCNLNTLWGVPDGPEFEPLSPGSWPAPKHRDYVVGLLKEHKELRDIFLDWHDYITGKERWTTYVKEIHGDPTFANVMCSMYGGIKLIDPIPADDRMPAVKAVDLGKLLQSALGYEKQIGYEGDVYPDDRDENLIGAILLDEHRHDQQAAWYFCFVHLARALRYHPKTVREWMLSNMEWIVRTHI